MSNTDNSDDPIIQYIVVRGDLDWPRGSLMANASHASVAAIYKTIETDSTKKYLNYLEDMHKIVLKAENLNELESVELKLKENKISHYKWIEKPEMMPTALATAPLSKLLLKSYFRKLKLFI